MCRPHDHGCAVCFHGPVYDIGLCRRCYSQYEARECGFIDECHGCGEIHDVIELCPEMQWLADEVTQKIFSPDPSKSPTPLAEVRMEC